MPARPHTRTKTKERENMKKTSISLFVCAALFSAQAYSADEFNGAYVGGKLGVNSANSTSTNTKTAVTYGAELGYNWTVQNMLIGVDGFYDANDKATHDVSPAGQVNYGSNVGGLDLKLGLPMDNLLPYVKLGIGHLSGTSDASAFGKDAFHGGLGLEYKFAPNWSVAGEWTTINAKDQGVKFKNNNLTVNVNYYFGGHTPAPAPAPIAMPKAEPAPPPPAPTPAPKVEKCENTIEHKKVSIEGANFATASAKLSHSADSQLDQVVDFAKKNPGSAIQINGYTDNRGKKEYNVKLSQQRAESVKAYLVAHGVAAGSVSAKGLGMEQPVADNKTEAGRAQNRRVEIDYDAPQEKRVCHME